MGHLGPILELVEGADYILADADAGILEAMPDNNMRNLDDTRKIAFASFKYKTRTTDLYKYSTYLNKKTGQQIFLLANVKNANKMQDIQKY